MLFIEKQKSSKQKKKCQLNLNLIYHPPDFSKTVLFSYSAYREMDQDERLPWISLNLKLNLKCTVRERLVEHIVERANS